MSALFGDEERAGWILEAQEPREHKQLGREVENFDEEVWCKHRWDIVYRGNLAKVGVAVLYGIITHKSISTHLHWYVKLGT